MPVKNRLTKRIGNTNKGEEGSRQAQTRNHPIKIRLNAVQIAFFWMPTQGMITGSIPITAIGV